MHCQHSVYYKTGIFSLGELIEFMKTEIKNETLESSSGFLLLLYLSSLRDFASLTPCSRCGFWVSFPV